MRGAADGLNIVVPFGDKRYRELRPTIAIAPPSTQTNGNAVNGGTIDLDGTFALNGAMQPLKALWDKQQLAIVEATGSPDASRSHFEAQDSMESGTPGKAGDGWLNRALPEAGWRDPPLRAVAMGKQVPHASAGRMKPSPSATCSSSTSAIQVGGRHHAKACTRRLPMHPWAAPARTRSKP